MRILISYDITDDKRRRKVAKIMEGHGYRVQYSVFECDLDAQKLSKLRQRLTPLVKEEKWESVRFYPLSADCADRVTVLGKDLARQLGAAVIV